MVRQSGITGERPPAGEETHRGEHVKIKVKKVERIEATRPHLDPEAPQGAV
ncbi:hypothetical protein GCM10010168_73600 [Actinoplanes ianthinogenes]|uniref:Uncharacterized protein n=1 Tax=Actinoplanes ianthinogenes TaxID=122358 RepID=A0ABM7LN58_9ACTN|nr:hypothetical protein Aiant_13090 [Actinoplanes ianthinogenes]GGR43881.1 hypothetical protein GCM10010168_73600 [Actinoplanes ianthinogenes]